MHRLEESQRWCAEVMRAQASSFYLSTRLLPKAKRHAIEAVYGFCRSADDTADEPGSSLLERRRTFASIRRDLGAISSGRACGTHPWFPALRHAFGKFPLKIEDAFDLVDGCNSDLGAVDVASMEDLERYSSAVAGTVGRFTVTILGASDEDSLRRAGRLGIAMQLTNVLRDVEEDWIAGRNYLPYQAFPTHNICGVMQIVAGRARRYYREAAVLAARVPNDGSRVAVLLARNMYEAILDKIDAREYDWSKGRAVVPLSGKLRMTVRTVLDAYVGFSTIK